MRHVHMLDPDHAPIRWEHLVQQATKPRTDQQYGHWTTMPNGWFVYQGPRLVTVHTHEKHADVAHRTATETVDHATLLRLLWDRMSAIANDDADAWTPEAAAEYTVLSAAFDLVESDLVTGSSLASWRGPRELVDMALTLAFNRGDEVFVTTEWEEF